MMLSLHIRNCLMPGKVFKTSREKHKTVQCIISNSNSVVCTKQMQLPLNFIDPLTSISHS